MTLPKPRHAAVVALLAVLLSLLAPAAWAQSRAGVIEDLQPIENRGDDTSERTKRGRSLGERIGKLGGVAAGIGLTRSGNAQAGYAVTAVAATHGDTIGGAIGEQVAGQGPATRYMVKVRLDEGRVLTLTQLRAQVEGLAVGSRVVVDGSGDEAQLRAQ